jgi:hypothetical protein
MKKFTLTVFLMSFTWICIHAQNFKAIPDLGSTTTVMTRYPFNMSYGYSRVATIYNKADIGGSGTIYKIALITDAAMTETSVPIVIKFKYSSTPAWGGTGTYATLSSGATTVYSGGYHFNSGVNYITLQTPFNFTFNVNHLIVFFEIDYGGSGSTSPISFVNKPIDSSVDYLTHSWTSNNSAPTTNGMLIDYQPLMLLYFDAPSKPISIAAEAACNENNISWQKNVANDMVIVISKLGSVVVNGPQCFENYTAGDSLGFGSYVVYAGGAATTSMHTPVMEGQMYHYRAWSFNTNKVFSELDVTSSALSAYDQPYLQDFDGGAGLPLGWTGSMAVMPSHGATNQGMTAQLQFPTVEKSISTPVYCNINGNTVLKFAYRIVNITGYPATATPTNEMDSIKISVSTDNGHTYTSLYNITSANHTPSSAYVTLQIPLSGYIGDGIKLQFKCKRGSGSYFVDIDNFQLFDATGIEQLNINTVQLFPNPTSGELFINITDNGTNVCQVYNIAGALCQSEVLQGNGISKLDVSQLKAGIYYLRVSNQKTSYHAKFAKN